MAEEEIKKEESEKEDKEGEEKETKSKWKKALALIPLEEIPTPKGVAALLLIVAFEFLQATLFPSGADLLVETIIHVLLVAILAKLFGQNVSKAIKNQLAPLVISAIPGLSDYLPEVIIMNVIIPFFL